MASFNDDEHRILIALYIEAQKAAGQLLGAKDLSSRYNLHVDVGTLKAVVGELSDLDYVYTYRTWEDVYVGLKPNGLKPVLLSILAYLDASTFHVSWKHERITTDATRTELIPGIEDWTMFRLEREIVQTTAVPPSPEPPTIPWPIGRNTPTTVRGDFIVHNHATGSSGHVIKGAHPPTDEGTWTKSGVIVGAVALLVAIIVWLFGDNIFGK